jgi:hypothetical protein
MPGFAKGDFAAYCYHFTCYAECRSGECRYRRCRGASKCEGFRLKTRDETRRDRQNLNSSSRSSFDGFSDELKDLVFFTSFINLKLAKYHFCGD